MLDVSARFFKRNQATMSCCLGLDAKAFLATYRFFALDAGSIRLGATSK